MAGDKPQNFSETGWTSTPYYQQVQASQSRAAQPSQMQPSMAGAMINPKTGEFLYQGNPSYKYYAEPQSGSVIEIFHGGHLEPSLPVTYYNAQGQVIGMQPAYANVVEEGKPFFGVGPDWKQVEIHGGKVEAVNQLAPETPSTSTISGGTARLLGGGDVSYVGQAPFGSAPTSLITTVSTPKGSETTTQPIPSRIVETALPSGGEYGVYDASGKLLSGGSYQYSNKPTFFGVPSAPNVPSNWEFSAQPLKNVAYNPGTGESVSYVSTISKGFIPVMGTSGLWTAPQTATQTPAITAEQQFDIEHPGYWQNVTNPATKDIVANSLEGLTGAPSSSVLGQIFQLYGQGVQAVETTGKTAINIATPLGAMQESIATKAWEHPFEIQAPYQLRYAWEHPSDVLTTAAVVAVPLGDWAAVPTELLGGEISAVAQEGIKTLFTPGYNPATANQWQSEFLGGFGSAAVAGQAYNVLRPGLQVSSQANIVSQLAKTGDIALATEASAFAGGVTYTGISTSLQGKQASYSELATSGAEAMMLALPFAGVSLRMETQAQQAYLKQLQEQASNPQALFEVSEKLGGTIQGGVKATEASETQVPGIVDEEYVNKLLEMQSEQGVPIKDISISAEGETVTYSKGIFYPSEGNQFTGAIKAGGIRISPAEVSIPAFYGEEPALPEMMTSGYVPTDVSASFNLQYKGLAPSEEMMSFNFPSEPEVDVSAAKQFFDIKPGINPFSDIQNVAYIKYPQVSVEQAGIEQVFPWMEGRTIQPMGDYTMKLPVGTEQLETAEPWYSGTGLEDKLMFQKIPADYFTTGVKYKFFEPPEGAVVSPESFRGIMLRVEPVEFNLPKGTPSWTIGDIGVDIIDIKAPPEINLKLTEGDRSLIEGYRQQNLLDELAKDNAAEQSQIQQELTKMQEQGQVIFSVKQVQQAEPLGVEALAKSYGISSELFPFTVSQASEVPATLPTPATVYDRSTLQAATNMFLPTAPQIKIAGLPSTGTQPFTYVSPTQKSASGISDIFKSSTMPGQKQASGISDLFKVSGMTSESELEKVTDLFKVTPVETQGTYQKQRQDQIQQQITITGGGGGTTFTPPPPPPPITGGGGFPKGFELPALPKGWGKFGTPRKGKPRSTFAPISDLWSRTASELMTGKIAHSPSLKVAQKFWKQTGGEFIPTAEQLAMKPRKQKPQKPFRMPKVPRPKVVRKPKGMSGMSMQHVMKGFKFKKMR